MPYPNEHAARMHDPGKYEKFARKNIAPGVDAVLGIAGGKSEVQAYRFDRKKFTAAEARAWLKAKNLKPISFEPATGKEAETEMPKVKMLDATFSLPTFGVVPEGLLVKDVTLLATGAWQASNSPYPLYYPEKILERDATKWVANGVWARHQGGVPRTIIEKVGEVRNPHYQNGAVVGDIFYHEKTQMSHDVANMIREGLVNSVSVEHGGEDVWNYETKRYEAASLEFYGLANVDRGACKVCTIKLNAEGEPEDYAPPPEPAIGRTTEESEMETKEAEKNLADLETAKTNLAKELEESKAVIKKGEDERKSLTDKVASMEKELAEAKAKIAELSKAPDIKTMTESVEKEELEAPPFRVKFEGGVVTRT